MGKSHFNRVTMGDKMRQRSLRFPSWSHGMCRPQSRTAEPTSCQCPAPEDLPPSAATPISSRVLPASRLAFGWLSHDGVGKGVWEPDPSSTCQWKMTEWRSQVCKLGGGKATRGTASNSLLLVCGRGRSWARSAVPGTRTWALLRVGHSAPLSPWSQLVLSWFPFPSALRALPGRWSVLCALSSCLGLTPHLLLPFQLSQQIS